MVQEDKCHILPADCLVWRGTVSETGQLIFTASSSPRAMAGKNVALFMPQRPACSPGNGQGDCTFQLTIPKD